MLWAEILLMFFLTVICPSVIYYFGTADFGRKKPKIEYNAEYDAWFGVPEEKPEIEKPIKRKLDI